MTDYRANLAGVALGVAMACAWAVSAAATDPCLASARTDLERLYCEVVSRGEGAGLPSSTDFKRNDSRVQALLLKRPAARLGLQLPDSDSAQLANPSAKPQTSPGPGRVSPATPKPDPITPPTDPAPSGRLADCRLQGESITCPDQRFILATNQPNEALKPGVLDEVNRLGLVPFLGDRNDEEAVRRYLSDAYDIYIPKMLAIGLGGTTMSFTAFHNAFHTMEGNGVDFAVRMEQTYQLLKRDKKTLAVKARYHDKLPGSIELCTGINPDVIVCDNVGTNWVYVSPSR